jgi:hypothetical protein
MSIAVVSRNSDLPTPADWSTMLDMAAHFVESGMLPAHIKTPAAAVMVMQRGRELGVPPGYALNNIVYIQGKATTNSELMLALVYRDHGDGALVFTSTTSERCDVSYRRRSWSAPASFSFTIDDAKRAGLLANKTWQQYPAAMLRARAISAVARMAFPDSIAGMYTPEELGAVIDIDRDGHFVIVEPDDDDDVDPAGQLHDVPDDDEPERSPDFAQAVQNAIDSAGRALIPKHLRWAYLRARDDGVLDVVEVQDAFDRARQRLGIAGKIDDASTRPASAQQELITQQS